MSKEPWTHLRLEDIIQAGTPCPECGTWRIILWQRITPRTTTPFFCECSRCGWRSPARGSRRYAIRAWGKREADE